MSTTELFPELIKLIENVKRVIGNDELPNRRQENLTQTVMYDNAYSNSLRRSLKRIQTEAEVKITNTQAVDTLNACFKNESLDAFVSIDLPKAKGVILLPNGMVTW